MADQLGRSNEDMIGLNGMERKDIIHRDGLHLTCEYFEEIPDVIFIHCTVDDDVWSKETYRHYMDIWEETVNALRNKGIVSIKALSDSDKVTKFASMFGFDYHVTILTEDNQTLDVMSMEIDEWDQ